MYKKRKDYLIILLTILLLAFYIIIFNQITKLDVSSESEKIELYIQIGGMFFTSLTLILTYNSLRVTQKQKNDMVRPYLYLKDIDFSKQSRQNKHNYLDFDYSIGNSGVGMAHNIDIKIKRVSNKKIIYEKSFIRLGVDANESISVLQEIRSEIAHLKDNNTYYSFIDGINDDFEVYDYDDINSYKELIIEIIYYDVYGKKYKNKTKVSLDNDYDLDTIEESLTEY